MADGVVQEFLNRSVYPETIPRQRDHSRSFVMLILTVVILLVVGHLLTEEKSLYIPVTCPLIVVVLFVGELLHRVCLLLEEFKHVPSRYRNKKALFHDTFFFSLRSTSFAIVSIVVLIAIGCNYGDNPINIFYTFGRGAITCGVMCLPLAYNLLHLNSSPLSDSIAIENPSGLDYGSGMAYSYFHGFLKLILPKLGTEDKNLEELIKIYETREHVTFPVHKLFILIPLSTFCHVSLTSYPGMEESKSLDEKIMTVAAVKNRVYKNAVYKITPRGSRRREKVYVCVEYATPLKTFHDVWKSHSLYTENYRKNKEQIVLNFYTTLRQILKENDNCSNVCDLIFFNDKDENGEYRQDIADIILNRITEIQRQMYVRN